MDEKKVIIVMILVTLALLFGGVFWLGSTTSTPQVNISQNAKANVLGTNVDFGKVKMNSGNVVREFSIKNTGTDTLKLFNIKTSCHCTKAKITTTKDESPLFGMSSVSSWVGEVEGGKEAKLIVVFDPAFHGPQGAGPVNRYVSVETNDSSNNKFTFLLTGIVLK